MRQDLKTTRVRQIAIKKMDFTILSARINSILEYFTISKIELFYKGTILKLSFNRKNY